MKNTQIKITGLIAITAILIVSFSSKHELSSDRNRVSLHFQKSVSTYTLPANINIREQCIILLSRGNEKVGRIAR